LSDVRSNQSFYRRRRRQRSLVGRCDKLSIKMIVAYSPQARGRSERMFRAHQERLPWELALAGITELEAANRYIAEIYLPRYSAEFKRAAPESSCAFAPGQGATRSMTSCASSTSARRGRTTARVMRRGFCGCLRINTGVIISRPGRGFMPARMERLRSFMAQEGWRSTAPQACCWRICPRPPKRRANGEAVPGYALHGFPICQKNRTD